MSAFEPKRSAHEIKVSSDRTFGLVIAAACVVLGLWPLLRHVEPRWWLLLAAVPFGVVALVWPWALAPLNKVWMLLGLLLGKVMTPLAMGVLFYVVVTPFALLNRWLGRDPLHLKLDPNVPSYWDIREPPGPTAGEMFNQF